MSQLVLVALASALATVLLFPSSLISHSRLNEHASFEELARTSQIEDVVSVPPRPRAAARRLEPVASDATLTRKHCARMNPWGDVCSYQNLCFDGTFWMFLEADGASSVDDAPILDDWADLEEGYLRPRLQPVPEPVYFPFNSGAMRGKVVKPSVLEASGRKVTWTTSTVWRLPIHLQLSNIWFWGSRVMPVYRALRMNKTRVLNPPLPSFGEGDLVYVPMPSQDFKGAWFDATLAIATGGKPRVEYLDTWGSQWNTNNWVCMKHAVSSGTFAGVVPDAETGRAFRADAYEMFGVNLPATPANKVLFWLREPPVGRSVTNPGDMLKVAAYYNQTVTVMYKPPSTFKEHLELFASHGVIVAPHGAGLMNTLFLVPGSSVVELYPYHLQHNLYPLMAANMQIGHYPVYSYNGTDMWRRDEANFKYNCEDLTSMQINTHSGQCRSSVVNFFIDVDPYDFEVALVNAVEHSGHRLRFRNYRPIADNNTETGWNGAWDLAPGPMDVP